MRVGRHHGDLRGKGRQDAAWSCTISIASKEALDACDRLRIDAGMPESLEQLDELLVTLGASEGRS